MEKFLMNVLQLTIITWVGYSLLRWMLRSKKSRKSIANKVWQLLTNRIHNKLDNALRNQRKVLYSSKNKDAYPSNVIPLKKTK